MKLATDSAYMCLPQRVPKLRGLRNTRVLKLWADNPRPSESASKKCKTLFCDLTCSFFKIRTTPNPFHLELVWLAKYLPSSVSLDQIVSLLHYLVGHYTQRKHTTYVISVYVFAPDEDTALNDRLITALDLMCYYTRERHYRNIEHEEDSAAHTHPVTLFVHMVRDHADLQLEKKQHLAPSYDVHRIFARSLLAPKDVELEDSANLFDVLFDAAMGRLGKTDTVGVQEALCIFLCYVSLGPDRSVSAEGHVSLDAAATLLLGRVLLAGDGPAAKFLCDATLPVLLAALWRCSKCLLIECYEMRVDKLIASLLAAGPQPDNMKTKLLAVFGIEETDLLHAARGIGRE